MLKKSGFFPMVALTDSNRTYLISSGDNMETKLIPKTSSHSTKRKVELLASTPYLVLKKTDEYVVLSTDLKPELWRRVDVPRKSFAIRIDDLEYEFDSVVSE